MCRRKNAIKILLSFTSLLILILDSKSTISGMNQGIELCLKALIPALFPYMIITSSCSYLMLGQHTRIIHTLLHPCKLPTGTEIIFLLGLLGGYPVGAKLISDAHDSQLILKKDMQRMLMFCSNAGPSFIFGIIGSMFSQPLIPWIIWEIHILSAYFVGIFTAKSSKVPSVTMPKTDFQFSKAITSAIKSMGNICAWVVLFRVLLTFFDKWFLRLLPTPIRVMFSGLLEMSNGCLQLAEIGNTNLRFIISLLIITFGGFCITMQTASFIPSGTIKYYFRGKLYQCIIALVLAIPFLVLPEYRLICFLTLPLTGAFLLLIIHIRNSLKKQ